MNKTIFFWQDDSLKNIFYIITGTGIAVWFVMMTFISLRKPENRVANDERDNEIMNRVNASAGPIAMTAVAIISLVLMIFYLDDKYSMMSPYFLVYITMINVVVYWLAQAIITLTHFGEMDFARTVAKWGIRHLYDDRHGSFFFQRHRWYCNRINYLRWGQAWMFRALCELENGDNDTTY